MALLLSLVQLKTSKVSPVIPVTLAINLTEDILCIFCLPVLKDFPISLAKVLETESLIRTNARYCNICSGVRESDSKVSLSVLEIV